MPPSTVSSAFRSVGMFAASFRVPTTTESSKARSVRAAAGFVEGPSVLDIGDAL